MASLWLKNQGVVDVVFIRNLQSIPPESKWMPALALV
jgi:hypothetical protein